MCTGSIRSNSGPADHRVRSRRRLLLWRPALPHPDDQTREAIAAAAQRLDELRRSWLNRPDADEATLKKRTLTNLYNERPTWLANAHASLDRAVWAAYGWPKPPEEADDETTLARLLALNLERAARAG